MEDTWQPMTIAEVAHRFAGSSVAWWIAGGHAIDLFLGWETRPHDDLDVEMFRHDRISLFDIFEGWELQAVSSTGRSPWTDADDLDESAYGAWLRRSAEEPWRLEIMFADGDATTWRLRQEPSITMPFDRLVMMTSDGIPYSAPEVQLLLKSFRTRTEDDVDMTRCLHRMDTDQLTWLADAVARTAPTHPWTGVLAASLEEHRE